LQVAQRKATPAVPALVRQPVRWAKGLAIVGCAMLCAFFSQFNDMYSKTKINNIYGKKIF